MREQARLWLNKLLAAVISGGATTALAALGIAGADAMGASVKALDFRQTLMLFISGALVGLFAYLKQSPIPPD